MAELKRYRDVLGRVLERPFGSAGKILPDRNLSKIVKRKMRDSL